MPAFLNRFTEFVTSTRSDGERSTDTNEVVDLDKVLQACFKQFGSFGHNFITLTWILRCKEELSKEQYDSMLSNLYRQANSPLEDPDDEIDQAILAQCQSADNSDELYDNVHRLVFGYTSNLHQITLADALCFLHERFPEHIAELKCVAEYQRRARQARCRRKPFSIGVMRLRDRYFYLNLSPLLSCHIVICILLVM